MRTPLEMTSKLLLTAIVALAMSGCGKTVERRGGVITEPQTGAVPTGVPGVVPKGNERSIPRAGESCDIIGTPAAKEISAFSEIAEAQGAFELVSFEAVGLKKDDAEGSSREGVTAIQGHVRDGGAIAVNTVCENMEQMPLGTLDLKISAPLALTAKEGMITDNVTAQQKVFGRRVLDAEGNRRVSAPTATIAEALECTTADSAMDGVQCAGETRYYKLEDGTIGILHVVESRDGTGAIVTGKIYAKYVLKGKQAEQKPAPAEPAKKPEPKPGVGQGKIGQGGIGQGKIGQGAHSPR